MIRDAIMFVETISHGIAFAANITVFIGGFYIALHSRMIPNWLTTCLWYIGLANLFNAITIGVEWTWDSTHPLSHFQIGVFTETLSNASLAVTIAILFFNTVWKDYLGSKKRQGVEARVDAKAKAVAKKPVAKKVALVKKAVSQVKRPTRQVR